MSYSCSGGDPSYNITDPYDHSEIPEGALAALERVQQSEVRAFGPDEAEEWDAVFRSEGRVVFLYERTGPGFPYSEVQVRRESDGQWGFSGSGDCRLRSTPRDGWRSAEWSLIENPEPEDRELVVRATEIDCSGGRKLAPDDFHPVVHTEKERISVAMYVEPPEGNSFTCEGNPSTKVTIELDEAVGRREIYNIAFYPPRLETQDAR